jgi:hypothetical protein
MAGVVVGESPERGLQSATGVGGVIGERGPAIVYSWETTVSSALRICSPTASSSGLDG